jgi:hypothetical protein
LGFAKVPIIQHEFAKVYAFDKENSIIYAGDDLEDAMLHAIAMSKTEYARLRGNIKCLASRIYEQSIANLERVLAEIRS